MREEFRIEAAAAGLSSVEPAHPSLFSRWNSTHEMYEDSIMKHIILDSVMDSYSAEI